MGDGGEYLMDYQEMYPNEYSEYCRIISNNMSKKYIDKIVIRQSQDHPFKFKDLKKLDLENDDIITCQYEEGFYSENNSWDGGFVLQVNRKVLETDKEVEKRKKETEEFKKEAKRKRKELYLELKKEFEDEKI